ncbi:hypothetical protein VTN49DRAFT_1557 [Thermomyces lanuginosus]|uniref:uncharacterized protein n=1 Tax=Thermomyces lanuginosus TaxID=5541 RepID=UPI00374268BE
MQESVYPRLFESIFPIILFKFRPWCPPDFFICPERFANPLTPAIGSAQISDLTTAIAKENFNFSHPVSDDRFATRVMNCALTTARRIQS